MTPSEKTLIDLGEAEMYSVLENLHNTPKEKQVWTEKAKDLRSNIPTNFQFSQVHNRTTR